MMNQNHRQNERIQTMRVKPSKPVSAGALVVLIFMLAFGIVFFVAVGMETSGQDEPALKYLLVAFGLVWCGAIVLMIIYHVNNLRRARGWPMIDIESASIGKVPDNQKDPMQKLRELESLKKEKLISDQEYEMKRREILSEKW